MIPHETVVTYSVFIVFFPSLSKSKENKYKNKIKKNSKNKINKFKINYKGSEHYSNHG